MKRKCRLVVAVLFSLLFLVGFGKKSVELLSDKKLIDLNAAINVCLSGADSSEQEDGGKQEGLQNPADPTVTPEPSNAPAKKPEQPDNGTGEARTIVISVRERVITYDSEEQIKLVKLEDRLRKDYKNGADFKLVDDFAEAHVYRGIMAILEKLEAEIGISYTRD